MFKKFTKILRGTQIIEDSFKNRVFVACVTIEKLLMAFYLSFQEDIKMK